MQTNNKLREALKDMGRLVEQIHFLYSDYPSEIHEIARKVNAALAEPVKNYEVGTVGEQYSRFRKFCKKGSMDNFEATAYCAYECPCGNNYDCKLAWAQMPYEVGAK